MEVVLKEIGIVLVNFLNFKFFKMLNFIFITWITWIICIFINYKIAPEFINDVIDKISEEYYFVKRQVTVFVTVSLYFIFAPIISISFIVSFIKNKVQMFLFKRNLFKVLKENGIEKNEIEIIEH